MYDFTPEEIVSLSKVQGRRIDDAICVGDELINKFHAYGLLCVGTAEQNLEYADMNILRKLLKEKGLKAGGKKRDLVQRILQNYSYMELECADIPKRFVLTEEGKQIINKNKALLFYFNGFGSTGILNPEEIISSQCSYPADNEHDILIRLFKERIAAEKSIGKKRAIMAMLCRLYKMKHDDVLVRETEDEIEKLDRLWKEEREKEGRELDSIFGMPLEERKRLQQQIVDEMGDDWEKELDAKNRARAGID